VAFKGKEIPLGVYFPAVSLYMYSSVRVNFGPSFILTHDIFSANAVSEVCTVCVCTVCVCMCVYVCVCMCVRV